MGRRGWRKLWQDALRSSPKWGRLTPAAKGLWFEMFLMAKETGALELRPGRPLTVDDFAFEMRTRPVHVRRWLAQLTEVGLVRDADGTLTIPSMDDLCTGKGQPRNDVHTGPDSPDKDLGADSGPHIEKSKSKKKTQDGYPPDFLQFWTVYPRKEKKGDALKAWGQRSGGTVEEIVAAVTLQRQRKQWTKEGGQFVPLPASWLRARQWEDEVTVPGKATPTTARVPSGHPCAGHREGETWADNGTHHAIRSGWWWTKREGGDPVKEEKVL